MGGHHLILGETRDYLTGVALEDTHDERYRQKIARLMVEEKGYLREELTPRFPITLKVGDKKARIRLDFLVKINGRVVMLVKYGPGSLTTRHQIAVAASRLLEPYQIPLSVVTNGEDADMIYNRTGDVIARGMAGIFSRRETEAFLVTHESLVVTQSHRDMAARILYAYEVDGRCPCDDTVCELEFR